MRISRIIVSLFGALFGVLGVGLVAFPERVAGGLHLEAVGTLGLTTLRADLGGLFLGLAALCLAGAWARRRAPLLAAATLLALIVVGRLAGLVVDGGARANAASLAIELCAIAALMTYARSLGSDAPPMRRGALVAAAAVAVALAGVAAAALSPQVQWALLERVAARQIQRNNAGLLADDALRVAICGTSAPLPSSKRAKACVAVIAGGKYYVVDAGPESVEVLMQWGIPLSRIGGVLLTHFHSDHIGDLGELNLQTWAQGRPAPLAVHGGPGVEQVVEGFNQAYRLDQGYRTVHHTAKVMPAETWPMVAKPVVMTGRETAARDRTARVLEDGALRITAIELDHGPVAPAYAYRFDYKGRSVVISGDTKRHPPLAKASAGADIMVSEAIARPMIEVLERTAQAAKRDRVAHIMHDIQDYHVSPQEAADIANRAGVKLLVFYHLLPAPDALLTRRIFAQGVREVRRGDWVIADDGALYTLPVGSKEVRIGRVPR